MPRRLATTVGVLVRNLNWACWLGQHRWQGWFELKVCSRCQLIGFRSRPPATGVCSAAPADAISSCCAPTPTTTLVGGLERPRAGR